MPNPYESERLLAEYLLFHYGGADEILPAGAPAGMREALDFALRTADAFRGPGGGRALDLGCAVGRSSYELSRSCDEVIGIDFSRSFVEAADRLRRGPLRYQRHDEGHLGSALEARLPAGVFPQRVRFEVGDATDLRADLGSFERVHAANLLCRLPQPRRLLERLPSLVARGGELVLATPCTWLGEFTPPERWPDGSTLDWLREALSDSFELTEQRDEPFLIRETARKFQWTASQLSRWRRI